MRRLLLLWLLLPCALLAQTTIHVPQDQPTIQAAINAAHTGDTVLVSPGTYYENIDFLGKAITVTSVGGAAATIIDGRHLDSTVTFQTHELRSSVISNFTIRNGQVPYTGSPTNEGGKPGGGILAYESAPTILGNIITANYCTGINSYYGAAYASGNTVTDTDDSPMQCMFQANAPMVTLGLTTDTGLPPTLITTFVGNKVENNTLTGSATTEQSFSAGIATLFAPAIFQNNTIRNNSSVLEGGALRIDGPSGTTLPVIASGNLIYGNATPCASGIMLGFFSPAGSGSPLAFVLNNTVADNQPSATTYCSNVNSSAESGYASQVSTYWSSDRTIFTNNIFTGSSAKLPVIYCFGRSILSQPFGSDFFQTNDIYNPSGPAFDPSCAAFSSNNLSVAPSFNAQSASDYHLLVTSPLVDVGNNAAAAQQLAYDLDAVPRVQDATGKGCIIDLGALEVPGNQSTCLTESLASSLNPSVYGQTVMLTAQLSYANGVPTGSVQFMDGSTILGTQVVSATGSSSLSTNSLAVGSHTISANFQPGGAFPSAVATLIQIVTGYPTTTGLMSSANPSISGQAVALEAHVSSNSGTPTGSVAFTDNGNLLGNGVLNGSGTTTLTTSSLTLGQHTIIATYQPTGTYSASSAQLNQTVLSGYATTLTASGNPNPTQIAQSVTVTAHVASSNGVPTGSVTFANAATPLGSAPVDASGNAAISTSFTTRGSFPITANYTPTGSFAGTSTTFTETVSGTDTVSALRPLPTGLIAGTSTPITATVAAKTGSGTPTGGVSFLLDGAAVGTGALSAGSASITANLPAGTHTLACVYAGDTVFNPSSCAPISFTVAPAPVALTLTSSANPGPALAPITFTATLTSNGSPYSQPIVFTVDGQPTAGTSTTAAGVSTLTLKLPAGTHIITASAAATSTTAAATASLTETVAPNPTATTLQLNPSQPFQGQTVTATVTLSDLASPATPYGLVEILSGSTVLASTTTTAAAPVGTVTLPLNNLSVTNYNLTARFTPADGNFLPSVSAPVGFTVQPSSVTLSADPTTLSIQTGHNRTLTLTAIAQGAFSGTVQLGCVGPLPPVLKCFFDQTSLSVDSTHTAGAHLRLETDAVNDFYGRGAMGWPAALLLLPLAAAFRRRRGLRLMVLAAIAVTGSIGLASLTGCSGQTPISTPPGTYIVTVSGTATSQGTTFTTTLPITLTVTP